MRCAWSANGRRGAGGPNPRQGCCRASRRRRELLRGFSAISGTGFRWPTQDWSRWWRTRFRALRVAASLVKRFQDMLRTKTAALENWLTDARGSLLAAFAAGIAADRAAVTAAITEPWSNGQTEGQINKVKLLKRQMYGRAGLDLLRARLIAA
uniref:transposase n=1 Tax=Rhodovastum atsumiense TaxID=504468 RepID=UPI001EF02E0B